MRALFYGLALDRKAPPAGDLMGGSSTS